MAIAAELIAWLHLLALDSDLAVYERKALRYRLLHVLARLAGTGRRRHLRTPATWPWATQLATAFTPIGAIPRTQLTPGALTRPPTTRNRKTAPDPVGRCTTTRTQLPKRIGMIKAVKDRG